MIKMIPDFVSENIKSNAERKVFSAIKNSVYNEQVNVLHSLGMAEHTRNIFGEIDFVIICSAGIICIEVKGGSIQRQDGIWYFTNRYGKTESNNTGPFHQVQNNMHSLRLFLIKKLGNDSFISNALFSCCVIMPDCIFNKDGPDIIYDILFDMKDNISLKKIIDISSGYWKNKIFEKHKINFNNLSVSEINLLANLLRGDFKIVPDLRSIIDNTERELLSLTDEQYILMENLNDNERLLISGMAGTGKTLLALEQCRRLYWSGKKVLFLCYNKNISEFVKTILKRDSVEADVYTFHSYIMMFCDVKWSKDFDSGFYLHGLPELFISKNIKKDEKYEAVIIDEGQDLFRNNYLKCIDKLLINGLQNGLWNIFYDPNQNIYIGDEEINKIIEILKIHSAIYRLSINCRNTRQIVNANILTSNVPQAQIYKASGLDVEYIPYSNLSEEFNMVRDKLLLLMNAGVFSNEIVLLSEYKIDNPKNCLSKGNFPKILGKIVTDRYSWAIRKDEIYFSTIHSFKGLESKIVFLLDVESFKEKEKRLLNYIAISRACTCLYFFYNKTKEIERQEMLQAGYPLLK